MLNVMDVADFFIATANEGDPEEDDGMTNMKLNKLLFLHRQQACNDSANPCSTHPSKLGNMALSSKAYIGRLRNVSAIPSRKSPNLSTGRRFHRKLWICCATYTAHTHGIIPQWDSCAKHTSLTPLGRKLMSLMRTKSSQLKASKNGSKNSLCLSTCSPNPIKTSSLPSLTRKDVRSSPKVGRMTDAAASLANLESLVPIQRKPFRRKISTRCYQRSHRR